MGELNPKAERCRLEAAHAHAAALGPALNAVVEIASPASSGIAGPLSGLPYAAKDMFRTPRREPGCGFGTGFEGFSDLIGRLAAAGADLVGFTSMIVTGGSTSGCVRAIVVDNLSHSCRTIVLEECVADKHESLHFANLYDMAVKYADVVPVAEVIAYLRTFEGALRATKPYVRTLSRTHRSGCRG